MRALIQHLVQPLRPTPVRRADAALLLPGKVVVLKGLDDPAIHLVGRRRLQFLRREEQREVRLCRLDAAVVQIPERRVDMVPVADQRDDRHAEQLAELAQRCGQDGGRAAERIARLGVEQPYGAVVHDALELADQRDVVGELPLADAADIPQQLLAPDKTVDCHDIIGAMGIDRPRRDLEVQKGVMVAQHQIRRL